MSANQLYLLADHIKLSLLERQRAQSLNLPNAGQQDAQIKLSLEQFKSGLEALEKENRRLIDAGDVESAGASADSLLSLQKQYDDLTSQFHGFSSPTTQGTLPNDHSLEGDFVNARSGGPSGKQYQRPKKTSLRTPSGSGDGPGGPSSPTGTNGTAPKTVRFSDNPPSSSDIAAEAAEAELFGRYQDDPLVGAGAGAGYADNVEREGMSNVQIHAYHDRIMREQDEQLDALGATIGRQRELSLRIGDELDEHVQMLDHMDTSVDRHGSRLGRARQGITKVAKGVGESKQMMIIILLILILVILIAVTK